jgi:hypothetical protein
MWSTENLKSTRLRKLFKIFKSSLIQSLNNFSPREGTGSKFTSLSWFWILKNLLTGPSPQAAAQNGLRPGQPVPGPSRHRAGHQAVIVLTAERVPVTAGRCRPMCHGGLIPSRMDAGESPLLPFPLLAHAIACAALLRSPPPTPLLAVIG